MAVVVPPHVLVEVALQPLGRHRLEVAPDAVLQVAEEAVDGVRVHVAFDVDAVEWLIRSCFARERPTDL